MTGRTGWQKMNLTFFWGFCGPTIKIAAEPATILGVSQANNKNNSINVLKSWQKTFQSVLNPPAKPRNRCERLPAPISSLNSYVYWISLYLKNLNSYFSYSWKTLLQRSIIIELLTFFGGFCGQQFCGRGRAEPATTKISGCIKKSSEDLV